MEIDLAPDTQAELQHLALAQGKTLSQVVGETVTRAWEFLHEQDLWLTAHRANIAMQIEVGLAELDRGEGIPEHELDAYLARLEQFS